MTAIVVVIAAFIGALTLTVVKALAANEIKGRIERRITAHLDATIAMLPDEVQAQWAEEMRADLAACISMPITAMQFVRGVRLSAGQLIAQPVPAAAHPERASAHPPGSTTLGRCTALVAAIMLRGQHVISTMPPTLLARGMTVAMAVDGVCVSLVVVRDDVVGVVAGVAGVISAAVAAAMAVIIVVARAGARDQR